MLYIIRPISPLLYITNSKINPIIRKTIGGAFNTIQVNFKYLEGNLPIIINTNLPT